MNKEKLKKAIKTTFTEIKENWRNFLIGCIYCIIIPTTPLYLITGSFLVQLLGIVLLTLLTFTLNVQDKL